MALSHIKDIIERLAKENPDFREALIASYALKDWAKIVGKHIADHTEIDRVREGVAFIRVDHPLWMQELNLQKHQILEKLNAAYVSKGAKLPFKDIRWVLQSNTLQKTQNSQSQKRHYYRKKKH